MGRSSGKKLTKDSNQRRTRFSKTSVAKLARVAASVLSVTKLKSKKEAFKLKIGVEIECLVTLDGTSSGDAVITRLKKVKNDLSDYLPATVKVDTYAVEDFRRSRYNPHPHWTLKGDSSLRSDSVKTHNCEMEIVSPILFDNGEELTSNWQSQTGEIWSALNRRPGGVETNETCATHVHLSPNSASGEWKVEDLQKLCCCILYFERAFEVLYYPDDDRYERVLYAKASWADNRNLQEKDFETCAEEIRQQNEHPGIVDLMNPKPERNPNEQPERDPNQQPERDPNEQPERDSNEQPERGPNEQLEEVRNDRYFAWNFENLIRETKTVEYRRPPGVKDYNTCVAWVTLAIAFVRAALKVDLDDFSPIPNEKIEAENVHVGHLRRFLESGLPEGKVVETSDLAAIFEGKGANRIVKPVTQRFTKEHLEEFERRVRGLGPLNP